MGTFVWEHSIVENPNYNDETLQSVVHSIEPNAAWTVCSDKLPLLCQKNLELETEGWSHGEGGREKGFFAEKNWTRDWGKGKWTDGRFSVQAVRMLHWHTGFSSVGEKDGVRGKNSRRAVNGSLSVSMPGHCVFAAIADTWVYCGRRNRSVTEPQGMELAAFGRWHRVAQRRQINARIKTHIVFFLLFLEECAARAQGDSINLQ